MGRDIRVTHAPDVNELIYQYSEISSGRDNFTNANNMEVKNKFKKEIE